MDGSANVSSQLLRHSPRPVLETYQATLPSASLIGVARAAGGRLIVVDAIDNTAARFYEERNFRPLSRSIRLAEIVVSPVREDRRLHHPLPPPAAQRAGLPHAAGGRGHLERSRRPINPSGDVKHQRALLPCPDVPAVARRVLLGAWLRKLTPGFRKNASWASSYASAKRPVRTTGRCAVW